MAKKPAKNDEAKAEAKLVKMVRDKEQHPNGPHEADVHPDMVDDYASGGWVKA